MNYSGAGGNCLRHSRVRSAETGKGGRGTSETVPVVQAVDLHARTARCDDCMGRQAARSASSATVGPRPPAPASQNSGSDWTRTLCGLASLGAPAGSGALVGEVRSAPAVGAVVLGGGDDSALLAASLHGAGGPVGRPSGSGPSVCAACAGFSESDWSARRPRVAAWWPQWCRHAYVSLIEPLQN